MNLFILDESPVKAARMQCDKHVVKMIVESAQMMSTANRILDGKETKRPSKSGKTMTKYWELPDKREDILEKINPPFENIFDNENKIKENIKNLLEKLSNNYISYLRGKNPFTFAIKLNAKDNGFKILGDIFCRISRHHAGKYF